MFDPLFTLTFLLVVWVALGVPIYWIAKIWLPNCSPVTMALVVPIAGMVGFFGINVFRQHDYSTPPVLRVALSVAAGLTTMAVAGFIVAYKQPPSRP